MANVKLLVCLFMLTVTVGVVCGQRPRACYYPLKIGPCKALKPRWFYNKTSGQCEMFNWGGCRPNGNNFLNESDCESKCEKVVDRCSQPKESGPCLAAFRRWYFDKASGKCKRFIYGGCQGNGNNFRSKRRCLRRCAVPEVCKLNKEPGRCKAFMPRYYYNKYTGRCHKFIYGGCGGNGNNFKTWRLCKKSCRFSRN